MNIDEDDPMVSLPTTMTPVCDRIEEIGHRSSANQPIQEGCSNEVKISDAEGEAQQVATGNNSYENRPALGHPHHLRIQAKVFLMPHLVQIRLIRRFPTSRQLSSRCLSLSPGITKCRHNPRHYDVPMYLILRQAG